MSENQIVESSFTAIINASTAPSGVSDNSPAGSTTCLSRYALIADADQIHSVMYPGSIFDPLFTPPLTSLRRGAERHDHDLRIQMGSGVCPRSSLLSRPRGEVILDL